MTIFAPEPQPPLEMAAFLSAPPDLTGAAQQPSPGEILQDIIDRLTFYGQVERDPQDLAVAYRVKAQLQALLAQQQQQQDQATGAGPAARYLRRQGG